MKHLNPREQCKSMSLCFKHGIRIYPVPYGNNFKITVEKKGKPETGDKIFYPETKKDSKTGKILKMGVWDKIWQTYEQIAQNIMNSEKTAA